jgi:hypothetical protein
MKVLLRAPRRRYDGLIRGREGIPLGVPHFGANAREGRRRSSRASALRTVRLVARCCRADSSPPCWRRSTGHPRASARDDRPPWPACRTSGIGIHRARGRSGAGPGSGSHTHAASSSPVAAQGPWRRAHNDPSPPGLRSRPSRVGGWSWGSLKPTLLDLVQGPSMQARRAPQRAVEISQRRARSVRRALATGDVWAGASPARTTSIAAEHGAQR